MLFLKYLDNLKQEQAELTGKEKKSLTELNPSILQKKSIFWGTDRRRCGFETGSIRSRPCKQT